MAQRIYRFNSEWMPKGFPHNYDAHIYFSSAQTFLIEELQKKIKKQFVTEHIFVGDIITEPIGPHTLPMLEVNFSKELYSEFVSWLKEHRENLNILIHPQSGNDYNDHTEGALWLGTPVDIKLEVFK